MNNQQLFNPYRGINQCNLSDASVCYPGNPISTCVNFTPNTNIKTMSSNVYHGEVGRGGAVSIEGRHHGVGDGGAQKEAFKEHGGVTKEGMSELEKIEYAGCVTYKNTVGLGKPPSGWNANCTKK